MGQDLSGTGQMIFLDPPEHTRLRTLVSRAFTPKRTTQLEERVRELCARLLDPFKGADELDYVADFGDHLPSMVISSLLGLPETDQRRIRHIIDGMFHIEPDVGMVNETSINASLEVGAYIAGELEKRRDNAQDDLLTALVEAEIVDDDGEVRRLTNRETLDFATMLFVAGTETVGRLLGWTAVILDANPDQRAELAADSSLIPKAVEELLRYEVPSGIQGRTTTRDVELHDTVMPEGSKVLLLTGAAGRDERAYPDPDRFDIHRSGQPHVSFGYGVHFCLGAALERLEGRVALEETLKRFPTWEVDRDRAVRMHTSTVRGFSKVPIRV
jgi:cytochrome P450